jgi:hypothetical protein
MSIFWEVTLSIILSKIFMNMCSIPNGFRDRSISLYSSKIVDKKEILRTVSNTGIYCSSDKVGTIHFREFHCQHHCTLQLVWGHGVLLFWVHLDVHANYCTVKQLYLGNRSEYDTCTYTLCLLRLTDPMTSRNIDLCSWDILCMDLILRGYWIKFVWIW